MGDTMRRLLAGLMLALGSAGAAEAQNPPMQEVAYAVDEWIPISAGVGAGGHYFQGCTSSGQSCHYMRIGGGLVLDPTPEPDVYRYHFVWSWNSVHVFNSPGSLGEIIAGWSDGGPPNPVLDYYITPSLCTDINTPCAGTYFDNYMVLPSGTYYYKDYWVGRFYDNASVRTLSMEVLYADGTAETVVMQPGQIWYVPEPSTALLLSAAATLLVVRSRSRRGDRAAA